MEEVLSFDDLSGIVGIFIVTDGWCDWVVDDLAPGLLVT